MPPENAPYSPAQYIDKSERIVQGDHYRYNGDLPRGAYLPAGADELALDARIREIEQAASLAWGRGRNQVASSLADQLGPLGDLKPEVVKQIARDLAQHKMAPGGDFDEAVHPHFAEYRRLADLVGPLKEQSRDMLASRVGAPEFAGMRQLDTFTRPQVESASFKAWFGDSKVVDLQGRPLIAFHGGAAEIDSFRTHFDTSAPSKNPNWAGQMGAWFAAPSTWADYEIGGAESTADSFAEQASRRTGEGAVIYPVYLSIAAPAEFEGHDDFTEQLVDAGGVIAFRRALENQGYDGVSIQACMSDTNDLRTDWIAFHAWQAKSATGNAGAFCRDDPDMCDRGSIDLAQHQRAIRAAAFVASHAAPVRKALPV
ncbi:hypothetical protein ACSFA0_22790 [Variovorax sp. LT1P1]|uniref:ADP-ribosyltransferase-containing protein n=1 Tax=Variovorax sp. LT1P1 TaxID=3443730 RepID=UPI003F47FFD4